MPDPLTMLLAVLLHAIALPPPPIEAPRPGWRWARENERQLWRRG